MYYNTDMSLILAIYVDDIMVFYRDSNMLDKLKLALCSSLKMKDLGSAKTCLGIRINYTSSGITLDQSAYIEDVLHKFGMQDSKQTGTPCEVGQKLSK